MHERRQRWWLRTFQLQDFGGLRRDAKVERELTRARGEQISEHRAEADAFPELGVGLANQREVRKGIVRLAVDPLGPNQSPLLHVTQMIVTDVLVPFEQLPSRDRGLTLDHRCRHYMTRMVDGGWCVVVRGR